MQMYASEFTIQKKTEMNHSTVECTAKLLN